MALSAGDYKRGAAGPATIVINCQTVDQGLSPPAFEALTRQKYAVLFDKPLKRNEVAMSPLLSNSIVEKLDTVETCN